MFAGGITLRAAPRLHPGPEPSARTAVLRTGRRRSIPGRTPVLLSRSPAVRVSGILRRCRRRRPSRFPSGGTPRSRTAGQASRNRRSPIRLHSVDRLIDSGVAQPAFQRPDVLPYLGHDRRRRGHGDVGLLGGDVAYPPLVVRVAIRVQQTDGNRRHSIFDDRPDCFPDLRPVERRLYLPVGGDALGDFFPVFSLDEHRGFWGRVVVQLRMPRITPLERSSGVVSTFSVVTSPEPLSISARSVNVPPMSNPILYVTRCTPGPSTI